MIKEYIRKVIQESNILNKQNLLIYKMIEKSIKKLLATEASKLRFEYALKIAKKNNHDYNNATSLYYNKLNRSDQKQLKNNLTKEIVRLSEFFRHMLIDDYKELRNQNARSKAEYEVGMTYGMPAHREMDAYTARGYGYIFQDEFDRHVEELIPKYEQMINDEADKLTKKYGSLLDD